ncbi:hypothetical protein [uncultured Bradyrhizobium sp.]|uniref:hypothetical protein n=1 Tax=uncultured Bradyrhizobium sp. TaxID=199684 RepID=UPI0035C9BE78
MDSVLDAEPNFASLSIKDLLEARDLYHFHLLNKANVVGTAIGLYLIRHDEDWPRAKGEGGKPLKKKITTERTLGNSEVRDYSWPCVIAFVRQWLPETAFAGGDGRHPTDMVPKRLYMPDGRAVPVCVVKVEEVADNPADRSLVGRWPMSWLGGGLPILTTVQGAARQATAGCLVSDGHLTYVLTARHACGEPGTPIFSRLRGGELRIGESSPKQLTRLPFSTVYPAFPQRQSYLNLDVGLVRVDDVEQWSSNVYGLPAVGHLADIYEQNLTMKLIDQPVWAFGAASGLLGGTIKALFYRYRSVGGYDYVGDFLIAPNGTTANTRHGDSGAIWHLDVTKDEPKEPKKPLAQRDLRPLAIEWGGQVFGDGKERSNFAVATSLSNVCKLLDVELVTDLDRGVQGYWGRVGHYSIAAFAAGLLGTGPVADLMKKNLTNLSFELDTIRDENLDDLIKQAHADEGFIPLADVPDEVWKQFKSHTGGRDIAFSGPGRSTGPEHPQHYADIDIPYQPASHPGPKGQTLRDLCLANDAFLSIEAWDTYYADIAEQDDTGKKRSKFNEGILPFRVWQFFDAMAQFARDKDTARFVAAAGIVAHYVGDACQPLHGSMFADGDPTRTVQKHHPQTGKVETVIFGKGVHSAYETKMLDRHKRDLLKAVRKALPDGAHGLPLVTSGFEAAKAIIRLMDATATKIPPIDLCEFFQSHGANNNVATLDAMWEEFGDATADVIALGVRYLSMIWQSAWETGHGNTIPKSKIAAIDPDILSGFYNDQDDPFLPSLAIDEIDAVLKK